MAFPGQPGFAVPAGEDYLVRRIADLERDVREFKASVAPSFAPVVKRLEDADAAFAAQVATIAEQQVTIAGLLTQMVVPDKFNAAGVGFATNGTGFEVMASATLTTPAGYTKALVTANAYGKVVNNTGSTYLEVLATISGLSGSAGYILMAPSNFASTAGSHTGIVSGLTTGQTFVVSSQMHTSSACAANAINTANISGSVIWFR